MRWGPTTPPSRRGVSGVALSRDGKLGLTGDLNGVARTWDVATGKEQSHFCHIRWENPVGLEPFDPVVVEPVALVPGGRYALSADGAGSLCQWDITRGKLVASFRCNSSFLCSIGVSSDGKLAVTGDSKGRIILWDLQAGSELRRFQADKTYVLSVRLSQDSRRILSGGVDGTVRLWDAKIGSELYCFRGHTDSVHSVCFSPDGRLALSGSWDKTLKLWRLPR